MAHKFRISQKVRLVPAGPGRSGEGDTYEVTRLMPDDRNGVPGYRIRSRTGERAVLESEITPAA